MKIFDWVHRRFAHKEGSLAESGNKSCAIESDHDETSNALKVFDGWKEGILAIGTLGYHPLNLKQETEREGECFYAEKEIEEESNPLVYAHEHDYDGLLEMEREADDEIELDLEMELDAMISKERITLAELFSADSEKLQKKREGNEKLLGENEMMMMMMMKENKSRFSFAKKLAGDKDARPMHKLHRLMRKMLKRKIHPDEGLHSTETASLLPPQPQDAII